MRRPVATPVEGQETAAAGERLAWPRGASKLRHPLKLRIPTKLGFKNPKWITAMYVTNRFPGGFWEDRGYNWFGGV